jgi:adenylate cyclase
MSRTRRVRRSVIAWPARLALASVVVVANVVGAGVVLVLATFVIPQGDLADPQRVRVLNFAVFGMYLLFAVPVGVLWGAWRFRTRRPDAHRERKLVLYGPLRLVTVQAVLWMLAAGVFATLNAQFSGRLALAVGETVLLGGITTCALSYLLSERILRSTAERVLADDPPRRRFPGVAGRWLLFWLLGTGVPVIGLILSAVSALAFRDLAPVQFAIIVLTLAGTALVIGFLVTVGAARAVADPVNAVRRGLARVERGELDTTVPVYDGTELGQLQAGFNTMVAGLRERERIRDLFGRHVGRDVAQAAADAGEVRLGGEVREVAVLFVDLVGSTALTAQRPAAEIVALLNRFFAVVVEVVAQHDGWINKFEGDAALAVFGAPARCADCAGSALAAARCLAERLAAELPEVSAGIGVSAGDAVAGNVGDLRRYEYTVIGDPVNEAARLTDLAKSTPGGVVAAGRAVQLADADEAAHWRLGDETTLRGRNQPTRLAVPRSTTPTATAS